jgi:oxygen-independent coproporphyrinogen III oxidase
MSFSLYIHIPYCHSKCPYCDFNSHAAAVWPEEDYVRALTTEMERRRDEAPWAGASLRTIFFGGGTPSLFQPRSIARLIDSANRLFGLEGDAEVTLEANPGTVDSEKLIGLNAAGVNRISFGAQSFNPKILKFLGRIHSADETRNAVAMAHRAGFERLNLDVIFAVPGQDLEDVRYDLTEAAALGPDHISAYNLTFEEGTAFFTEMRRGNIRPLENDDQAAMYSLVRTQLPLLGYPMYEISNYAPAGHEARHNLTYWHAESYLGIGAGAHSCAHNDSSGGRRWWNERMPARYIDVATKTGLAEVGGESIDPAMAAGEFAFLNLRLREGFALTEFARRFGVDFATYFGAKVAALFENELLIRAQGRVSLSDRGLELADSVFAEFL